MDMTTCLKSLLLTMQQYRDSRTAQDAVQLQKQVEEVSLLSCERLLLSGQVLPSECVAGLVDLAGNPNTNPPLTAAAVSLLAQLVSCDESSRELLHSSYNLTSSLAALVHCHSATPGAPLVLQCLQVLQKLTYRTRVLQSSNYIHELIAFLMTNIQSDSEDVVLPCLGLLANLCRDNQSVQSHIKSLENVKPFYRTLINFLAHNSLTVVVFTLSILASLTLNEKVGEKLFDATNIHQTFQLVFNIVVNGDGTLTRNYSVDLLVDLLKSPKIADYLTRYQHFSACVSQVLGLLHSKDPESAAKVLELLLAMCGVPGLRSPLCGVFFRPPAGAKLRAGARRAAGGGQRGGGGPALLQWLSSPVEGAECCTLQTLQLLAPLLQESLGAEPVADGALGFVELLLPALMGLGGGTLPGGGDPRVCRRALHATRLLLVLCSRDAPRRLVSRQLSAQLCLAQVDALLACCHGNGARIAGLAPDSEDDLSQVAAEALLKTLELMSKLRQQVADMELSFYRLLQDQRMVTPLSLALTSHKRDRVQTGLALLFEAAPLPDFPSISLGESMAANNAYRQREAELSVKRVAVQEAPPPRVQAPPPQIQAPPPQIQAPSPRIQAPPPRVQATPPQLEAPPPGGLGSLVEKIQTGLELQDQNKEPRLSEIIEIYEQKLAAFASKESRLQDLLEAKSRAVAQADRLLAQYRLQRAQAEAEARQLGGLLQEGERRREALQAELSGRVLEAQRSRADAARLLGHNARLQRDSEEHQELKAAYNTLLSRTTAMLEEQEEKIKSLNSDLQKKSSDITNLRAQLRDEEEKVTEKEREKGELQQAVEAIKAELSQTEQARKDASIKASSLELQRSTLEAKLKLKEDELNKHSAMIAMIHSLSSGKLKSDVNLSL
ncbi:LOW QUALITY PROTEIN: protein CIP2A [Menidia menidia]